MNTLDSLFQWTLTSGVRASLMAVAVLAIQAALRHHLPANWRHALWFPVLLVLVLPILPTMPFSPFGGGENVMVVSSASLPTQLSPGDMKSAEVAAVAAEESQGLNVMAVLPVVWLAVATVLAGAGVTGHLASLRGIKRNGMVADAALERDVAALAAGVGLRRPPVILLSSAVESPAVTGLFKPLLLLPKGFPEGFTATEARLILVHELTHLKRHDLEVNALLCVVQALHWYNPVLWFAFAKMRADRETACDAAVLSSGAEDHRSAYGHALLKLQDSALASGLGIGFVGIFKRGSALRSRIEDIGRHRAGHRSWNVVGAGMVGLLVMGGATKAPGEAGSVAVVEKANGETLPGVDYINNKLDSLVIPAIRYKDTSVEEAIEFLSLRAKELDLKEKDPSKKGINFVVRAVKGAEFAKITWSGENVTLRTVLLEVAKRADLKYTVDEFCVTLLTAAELEAMAKKQNEREMDAAERANGDAGNGAEVAAQEILLPRVEFVNLPLTEAVAILNDLAAAVDPKAPKVVVGPKVDGTLLIVELRLRNVPLTEALKYLCDQRNLRYVSDDKVLMLNSK